MISEKKHLISVKSIAVTIVTAMLFYCCTSKVDTNIVIDFSEVAQGIGKEAVVKYTDSGRLVAVLKAPILLDFTHIEFPYREFPKGVQITVFNKKGGESNVKADYAIQYDKTHLVDLSGNVNIITSDSISVRAPQMYWDQKLHWIFTDNKYSAVLKNGAKNKGKGFDVNEDFTTFKSRTNRGSQILED